MNKKKVLDNLPEKILGIAMDLLGEDYRMVNFYACVVMPDILYVFEALDEYIDCLTSFNKPDSFEAKFYFKKSSEETYSNYTLTIRTSGDYIEVQINLPDKDLILNLFDELKNKLFINGYYKYNPNDGKHAQVSSVRNKLIEILESLDVLQVRLVTLINSEVDFQNFLYPILRSHFADLEDEYYLPKYGVKTYKPDFGIPSGKILIEAKIIKSSSDLKKRQSEIHDDVVGYLNSTRNYNKVVVIIYNYGNVAVNAAEIKRLEKLKGIERILFCNRVVPNNSIRI